MPRSPQTQDPTTTLLVVVADDDALVRAAVVDLIEADPRCRVVAAVSTAQLARDAVSEHRPDAVVLDLRMPGGGLGAARQIHADWPETTLTVLSAAWIDPPALTSLLQAGVTGVLAKGQSSDLLPDLLVRCCRGEVLLLVPAARRTLTSWTGDPPAEAHDPSGATSTSTCRVEEVASEKITPVTGATSA